MPRLKEREILGLSLKYMGVNVMIATDAPLAKNSKWRVKIPPAKQAFSYTIQVHWTRSSRHTTIVRSLIQKNGKAL
jgi:hypothetical protein